MSTATTSSKLEASSAKEYRGRMARNMLFVLLPLSLLPLILVWSMAYIYGRDFLGQQASSLLATIAETQGKRFVSQIETGQLLFYWYHGMRLRPLY